MLGLLLAILQFGPGSLADVAHSFCQPFADWDRFMGDGFLLFWFVTAAVMLILAAVAVFLRRFLFGFTGAR